jgi:type II secretory pathway component PulF
MGVGEGEQVSMELILPTIIAGSFAGLVLGLSHWVLPKMHVVFNYAYGSFWCLAALSILGFYLSIRWEFLVAAWVIWAIAGCFVAAQYLKSWADESRKNNYRVKESSKDDVYEN